MKSLLRKPVLAPVTIGLIGLAASGLAQAQQERARVISSTPVIQQVAVPQQVCQDQTVRVRGQTSGAGALIGGIAGGAVGNTIGKGNGRAVATLIGAVGGAIVGNQVEGRGPDGYQTVRNCTTQTAYENEVVGYDVTYEYAGRQYTMRTDEKPGRYVDVNVTPVAPSYGTPSRYTPPVSYTPAVRPPVSQVNAQIVVTEGRDRRHSDDRWNRWDQENRWDRWHQDRY